MPTNGTPGEIAARALTDAALAQRLGIIRDQPRTLSRTEKATWITEAARRLLWGRKAEPTSTPNTFTATFTKNEQVFVTQVLVLGVAGTEWDEPSTWHGGLGPDCCEGCTALFKLGVPPPVATPTTMFDREAPALGFEAAERKHHYDRHSRTNPMENCNQPECRRASRIAQ